MVLLHLLLAAGYKPSVVHANFELRGRESDSDENFVRTFCASHHLPFFSQRFETNNYATAQGISIQMAARELRYNWFHELVRQHGFNCLATAHHANDNVETVLLNLVKGAGIEGHTGIKAKSDFLIRPLLFATREQIEQYAAERGIKWREDVSNTSNDYQRNFLRHQVIPKLKEINPSLESTIAKGIEKAIGSTQLALLGLQSWQEKFVKDTDSKVEVLKSGILELGANGLYIYLKRYGFNLEQCVSILQCFDQQSGRKFASPEWELNVDREKLVIFQSLPWEETVIAAAGKEYALGPQKLRVAYSAHPQISKDKKIATLDADRVKLPLIWRKWKEGDAFQPLGMQQRKKLSDFFIDEKISLADKANATVLESQGSIIWVVGERIDDRYKITAQTLRTIILDCRF